MRIERGALAWSNNANVLSAQGLSSRSQAPWRWPKYCGATCRNLHGLGRAEPTPRPIGPRFCVGCGDRLLDWVPGHERNYRKWCSDACRVRHTRVYIPRAPRSAVHFFTCSECGSCFCSRSGKAKTCGSECSRARNARNMRESYSKSERGRELKSARAARRRAVTRGAAVIETFTKIEIFESDGWVCGICLRPIDRSLRYPDPASPSLDHIVPVARGGAHVRDNVQASHLRCNTARGARDVLTARQGQLT